MEILCDYGFLNIWETNKKIVLYLSIIIMISVNEHVLFDFNVITLYVFQKLFNFLDESH